MNDDERGRELAELVPSPAPGYWAAIDAALGRVTADRTVPGVADGGRRRARILMVAAVLVVGLAVAGGVLATRHPSTLIATQPEQSVPAVIVNPSPALAPDPTDLTGATDPTGTGQTGPVAGRAPTGSIVVTGDPLPAMPDGLSVPDAGSDPAHGRVAPELTGTDFDGTEVRIQPDGRRKAVLFVASWCPHCQSQVATLSELLAQDRVPDDLDLYVVSTAYKAELPPQPQDWTALDDLRRRGVQILRDDEASSAAIAYAEAGFPTIVHLDGADRVVARSVGELDADSLAELLTRTS